MLKANCSFWDGAVAWTSQVNLNCDCPFWPDDGMCAMRDCSVCELPDNEVPQLWKEAESQDAATCLTGMSTPFRYLGPAAAAAAHHATPVGGSPEPLHMPQPPRSSLHQCISMTKITSRTPLLHREATCLSQLQLQLDYAV